MSIDIYEQLKSLLMSGKMMPGQQFSLRSVAEALDVSVMPVREAMQRLVAERAMEIGPSRTIRVPMMTVSQFRELTSIRINLEGFATERACTNMSKRHLTIIEAFEREYSTELGQDDPDGTKLASANMDLHLAIYRASEMPMLVQLIETLWLRIGPILNYDLRSNSKRIEVLTMTDHRTRIAKSLSYHEKLVNALKVRDVEEAKAALKKDIETASAFIVSSGTLVVSD